MLISTFWSRKGNTKKPQKPENSLIGEKPTFYEKNMLFYIPWKSYSHKNEDLKNSEHIQKHTVGKKRYHFGNLTVSERMLISTFWSRKGNTKKPQKPENSLIGEKPTFYEKNMLFYIPWKSYSHKNEDLKNSEHIQKHTVGKKRYHFGNFMVPERMRISTFGSRKGNIQNL